MLLLILKIKDVEQMELLRLFVVALLYQAG
jgi:hypothetical protein